MTVPAADLTTTHLEQGTDDPKQARVELKACIDKLNALLTNLGPGDTVWTSGNDGPASGLNADLLEGEEGAFFLNLANASGTLAASKVGDGAGSGLDSDLLDGQQGTHYLSRSNHTGSQAQSTITNLTSDLADKADPSTDITSGSTVGGSYHWHETTSGLLINFGSGTVNKNSTTSLTFDTAFTALINVQITTTSANQDFSCHANNLSNSGFDVTADNSSGPASTTFHYVAFGFKT